MNKIFKILILIAFSVFAGNSPQVWGKFFSGVETANFKSYTQLKRYLEHSTSLNDIIYIFNPNKLNGVNPKNAFKNLFITKADDLFNTLGRNKINQLFKIEDIRTITNSTQFRNLFNTNQDFLDNALQFIKAE